MRLFAWVFLLCCAGMNAAAQTILTAPPPSYERKPINREPSPFVNQPPSPRVITVTPPQNPQGAVTMAPVSPPVPGQAIPTAPVQAAPMQMTPYPSPVSPYGAPPSPYGTMPGPYPGAPVMQPPLPPTVEPTETEPEAEPVPMITSEAASKDMIVHLRLTDKNLGRSKVYEVPTGRVLQYKHIEIMPKRCVIDRAAKPRPQHASLLEIYEKKAGFSPERLFSGWMVADDGSLSYLTHPYYDVGVVECEPRKHEKPKKADDESDDAPKKAE